MIEETPQERLMTLGQLIGNAHQAILNAPRAKDEADKRAMRVLELAYARAVPADPVVSPADTILQALNDYLPDGFRDEDGVWHDGPVQSDALVALDALLAVGERDRQHIERLTKALAEKATVADEIASECNSNELAQFHSGRASAFREAAAVLADKEDADGR